MGAGIARNGMSAFGVFLLSELLPRHRSYSVDGCFSKSRSLLIWQGLAIGSTLASVGQVRQNFWEVKVMRMRFVMRTVVLALMVVCAVPGLFGGAVSANPEECVAPACGVFGARGSESHLFDSALSSAGTKVLVGSFSGSATFGSADFVSAGGSEGVVLSIGLDGALDWSVVLSGPGDAQVSGVDLGADGSVFVVGSFSQIATLNDSTGAAATLVSGDVSTSFVARISAEGLLQWVADYGGHDGRWPSHDVIDVDASGDVYVAGHLNGEQQLGWAGSSYLFDAGGNYGSYVTSLTQAGGHRWSLGLRTTKARSIAVSSVHGVYVSGHFNGGMETDSGETLFNPGSDDERGDSGFVLQMTSVGEVQWVFPVRGLEYLYLTDQYNVGARTLAVDGDGTAVFLGRLMNFVGNGVRLGVDADAPRVVGESDGGDGLAVAVSVDGEYRWHAVVTGEVFPWPVFTSVVAQGSGFVIGGHASRDARLGVLDGTISLGGDGAFAWFIDGSRGLTEELLRLEGSYRHVLPRIGNGCVALTGSALSVTDFHPSDAYDVALPSGFDTAGAEFMFYSVFAVTDPVSVFDGIAADHDEDCAASQPTGRPGAGTGSGNPTVAGESFTAVDGVRPLDTRVGGVAKQGATAGFGSPLRVNIGALEEVPSGAAAVAVNITATAAEEWGFVAAYPCGSTSMSEYPGNSNVNFDAGMTVANSAIVPLDAGYMCLLNYGKSDVIVDVIGYMMRSGI